MFRRRERKSAITRTRDFFWPRMGFARLWRYIAHRLGRMPGTPYSIAAGVACGAAVSFTPLIGLHFVLAGLLAWALRANILASAIGTVVGNPWTFPFIWLWIYELGHWMIGADGADALPELTIGLLLEHTSDILVPMLIGGVPTGIAVWIGIYLPLARLIDRYQQARSQRRREGALRKQEAEAVRGRVQQEGAGNS